MDEKNTAESQKGFTLSTPVSIIIAGLIIAGAIVFTSNPGVPVVNQPIQAGPNDESLNKMREITSADHLRGNPDAPVKIVEYSDMECPFCKQFHSTLKQVMQEYGPSGKVAWVYRQFPLSQLHPKAPTEAEASECANYLGGNEMFWKFTDRFFEVSLTNNQTDITTALPQVAKEIGLDVDAFNSCVKSGKFKDKVDADIKNANETGGTGTPWSIVVAKNGKKFPLSGAQPYESVKQLIEAALKEN